MTSYLRYLRIAFSITCGIAAVLLCVLWVRSYFCAYSIQAKPNSGLLTIRSLRGQLTYDQFRSDRRSVVLDVQNEIGQSKFLESYPIGPTQRMLRQNPNQFLGFGWEQRTKYQLILAVPYWFLVIVPAAFAIGFWVQWSKRFSLRTLLIAITLVAVGLGIIIALSR